MKSADLSKIIEKFNADTLPGILPSELRVASGFASIVIPSSDISCRRDFCGITKATGKTKGYTSSNSFVSNCLTLSGSHAVIVGAVIDKSTEDRQDDLPVILAVGINYSQGDDYVVKPVPIFDDTKMRPRLRNVLNLLSANACASTLGARGDDFHLVAANFFPWITCKEWSAYKFNSIEEATLIHCFGHFSPTAYVRDLVSRIAPESIVFHGADNAVPYLGGCVSRDALEPIGLDVIFCDNLAHGRNISNAVKLRYCIGRQILTCSDYDD